jgi:hypothetical protein
MESSSSSMAAQRRFKKSLLLFAIPQEPHGRLRDFCFGAAASEPPA